MFITAKDVLSALHYLQNGVLFKEWVCYMGGEVFIRKMVYSAAVVIVA